MGSFIRGILKNLKDYKEQPTEPRVDKRDTNSKGDDAKASPKPFSVSETQRMVLKRKKQMAEDPIGYVTSKEKKNKKGKK